MVSIITVVRNGISTIEETILSVINQDYKDFEYIIIDGVSTDGTLEILNKYSDKIDKIISEPDAGIYDAMNKGIALANGDWIYFLGCDDTLYENITLSRVFSNDNYSDYDVVYGNVLFSPSNIVFDGKFDYNKHALKSICQQAIFYRKGLFETFGLFSTDYLTASDYIFNMKVFCFDIGKWLYIENIIANYNETGASSYSSDKKYRDNCFALRYDNFSPYVSKSVLIRVFYSSFYSYFLSHKLMQSLKYLFMLFGNVGFFKTIINLILIVWSKLKYTKA